MGIACATVEQRDLIAGQLLKIRQRKMAGWEKIQQLYLNGLGVYQFAEMQGQHVDIMLLSLTHGVTDAQGTLTRHLFLEQSVGFQPVTRGAHPRHTEILHCPLHPGRAALGAGRR
ncbi:MAG: hypothetical protein IPL27_28780 [Lewinellaceae bacterium]|nr:hypothetical protein [Lewinellaceae bacterium]